MNKIIKIFCLLALYGQLMGQDAESIKNDHLGLSFKFNFDLPLADLDTRFGSSNQIGVGIEKYYAKTNIITSAEFNLIFGNNVDQDVIGDLRQPNGNILAVSGSIGNVFLRQRGFYTGLVLEKILGKNLYGRGLRLGIGVGHLTHKIRVQNDTNDVPQVRGQYQDLYDHRTSGFAVKQLISYNITNKTRQTLIAVGLEFMQAFTKNTRALNLGSDTLNGDSSLDMLIGLNLRWTLPLLQQKPLEDIFY